MVLSALHGHSASIQKLRQPALLTQFIYISQEEMAAVADFIKRRGRVAISELAAKSNTFIDLEARASTVSKMCMQGHIQHARGISSMQGHIQHADALQWH